ncbi:MAG: hypothetical protein K2M22_12285 [Lachnospiraceae bacterium]|nr:hypothetical protein [Lachnospiraceae bacterium]
MSSSEEYLDSLLDSILGGNQSDNGSKAESSRPASGEPRVNAEAGKAMSTAEIEEMLVSMGTLGNGEDGTAFENMTDVMTDDLSMDNMSLDDLLLDDASANEDASEETVDLGGDDLSLDGMSSDDLSMDELL